MVGVYLLFLKGELVYAGQSKRAVTRVMEHLSNPDKDFDSVAFLSLRLNDLNRVEQHYIRKHTPKYNRCQASRASRRLKELGVDVALEPDPELGLTRKVIRVGRSRSRKVVWV